MEDSKFSKIYKKFKRRTGAVVAAIIAAAFLLNAAKEVNKALDSTDESKQKVVKTQSPNEGKNPYNYRKVASTPKTYNPYEAAQRRSRVVTNNPDTYREAISVSQEPDEISMNVTKTKSTNTLADQIEAKKEAERNKANDRKPSSNEPEDEPENKPDNDGPDGPEGEPKCGDGSNGTVICTRPIIPPPVDPEPEEPDDPPPPTSSTPAVTPEIVSITSSTPGDGTYTTGEVFEIIVTFDEAITTTTSSLTLSNGGTASYLSGTGSTIITYQYTAAGGEDTSDLNVSSFNVGDAVSSTSTAPSGTLTSGQNLADNQAIVIDTTAANIVSISSTETDGRYTNTSTIDITVTFDEIINSTASTLTLDTGATATYLSGTGSTSLVYQYTVGAAENSSDLNVTAFNIGDALDVVSIAPNAALPASNNLANNKALVIDNTAASIVNITGTNGTYTNTNIVDIVVTFDEPVTTASSTLSLDTGATAIYQSGSGTSAVTYRYTVGAAENSSDLTVTSFNIGDATDTVGIAVNTAIPGGQNLDDLHDVIIDNTAPSITNITSSLADGTYTIGQDIDIQVTFSEVITTSNSSLTLDTGGTASYQSGSASTTITYRYTVGAGENSADLNVSSFNVGDAVDNASIAPSTTIPSGGAGNDNLAFGKALVIDTNQATITNIESTVPGDGNYNETDVIDIIVTFDENITTSNSSLTLDTGGTASYQSGSGGTTITYRYTVGAGEDSADLNVTAFNTGDAVDAVSLAPSSTLPGTENLEDNNDIIIDTTTATVTEVRSATGDGTYGIGDTVNIEVVFSEVVNVTGTPQITLNSGATVDYTSGDGTNTLLFTYTVAITESSPDLDHDSTTALVLNSGTINDDATNPADLTLPSPGAANSIAIDHAVVIDGVVPTVTQVYSTKADGTYGIGEVIDIIVQFSENVDIGGTPQITLDSGAVVDYTSGDGTNLITFQYTVAATENSGDLDYVNTSSLSLNGGTIQDSSAGNNADLTLAAHEAAGSISDDQAIVIDTTGPTITDVRSTTPGDGTYGVGQDIDIRVTFSEAVDVDTGGGTPTLTLETGTTDRDAVYLSGSGSTVLVFRYTVVAGDSTSDLEYVNTSSLALNGGTIQDIADNNADLTLPTVGGGVDSLSDNNTIIIDTDGANVVEVYSNETDQTYTVGAVLDIYVEFSEAVDVTGTPQLTLNSGAVVDYTSGTGTNTLLFQYTVAASENSSDLDYAATTSLTLNGGTIEDAVNNSASLTLATPNAVNSISDDKAIVIDTQGPQITSISSTEADGTYGLGATIDIEITFDENVTVNTGGGTPTLALNAGTGVASYVSTASNVITLTYTVGAGQDSSDLDYDNISSLVLNGGTIQDALANNANLTIPAAPGALNSISDDQDIVIDTTAPTVVEVYSDKPDGTYGATEVIDIYVEFSEIVNVAVATPEITLNSGATVSYTSGSGTDTLLFQYTVGATDNSSDLDYVNTTSLDINGATIRDAGLNDAVLTLATPNTAGSISDDKAIVIDTNVASITNITSAKANGVYQSPEIIDIEVTFDEAITTSTSSLTLNTGATAVYQSGSGTSTITYRYTVGGGESTLDLNVTAFNVGDAVDAGSNPPGSGLPNGGIGNDNLAVNKDIAISDTLLTLDVYVRPTAGDCTGGTPANPPYCYTSLNTAFTDIVGDSALTDQDLVTQNVVIDIHIQDDWSAAPGGLDDDNVSISGWTTDSTRNITVQTEGVARHNGTATCLSCYKLDPSSNGHAIAISSDYISLDGLIITGTEDNFANGVHADGNQLRFSNMIIHDLLPNSTNAAFYMPKNNTEIFIENSLMYGNMRWGLIVYNNTAGVKNMDAHIYNTAMFIDSSSSDTSGVAIWGTGIEDFSSSNFEVINTYFNKPTTGQSILVNNVLGNPTFTGSIAVLTGDDTAQTIAGLNGNNSNVNVQFIDAAAAPGSFDGNSYIIVQETAGGSEDYHLVDNAFNLALGAGTDLTGTIPNDIDGDVITASQHQIGPDFLADTTGPVVEQVYLTETDGTTTKPDGAYGNAATMSFIVEFSQVISVTGTPQITHNASATPVNCTAHPSMWNALECEYTVGATDSSIDLDYVNTTSLALNGGTITDSAGNAADLTLPIPGALYSASDNQDIIINAGAVTLDIYVREDCTGAPGQCYTSLGDVNDNIVADTSLADKDLVTQNVEVVVHIDQAWPGGPDTNRATISGFTTDATHFVTVQTEGAARHDGTAYKVNAYTLDPSTSGAALLLGVGSNYTVIDGLVITGVETTNDEGIVIFGNQSRIKNTIIYDLIASTNGHAIQVTSNGIEFWVENCLIYGNVETGIYVNSSNATVGIDVHIHNTLVDISDAAARGVHYEGDGTNDFSNSNIEIINSAFFTSSGGDAIFLDSMTVDATFTGSTSVVTDDTSAQTIVGLTGSNSEINVLLVDAAVIPGAYDGNTYYVVTETALGLEDYHLADDEHNIALGSGSDLTATIPNDIDGVAITASQHQIGPDFVADTTGPVVQEVYLTEADGTTLKPDATYGLGEDISFIIEFSQVISTTAGIDLAINANASSISCDPHPSLWNALKCDYTVAALDASSDLGYDATGSLTLSGGSVTDRAGNVATLTLPAPGGTYSASQDQAVVIDTTGPVVTNVTSAETNGYYNATEDSLEIQVVFDEPITVGGTPTLTLETGTTDRVATFDRVDSGNIAIFLYDVQSGDESSDLDYVATTSLALNGGTITDALSNNADLTLPTPGAANSLANNKNIVIDAVQPTITDITSTKTNGTYSSGFVDIRVSFSETLQLGNTSSLTLDNGKTATYVGGIPGLQATYRYTIGTGGSDDTSDLTVATVNVGNAVDYAGNALDATIPSGGLGNDNLGVNKDIAIDTTAPTIVEVRSPTPDGTYVFGEDVTIEVVFSETVTVTGGPPQLALNSGATVNYSSGSPGNVLTFTYTVGAGDISSDLDYVATNSLTLNSALIQDAAYTDADLTLATPNALNSISDDKAIVISGGPVTVDVYVRPTAGSCAASPDPTLCYTTLKDVDSNIVTDSLLPDKDLVSIDGNVVIHIQEDWSGVGADTSTNTTFSGWTTDATHFITIQTEGVARHNGTASCTTCYKMNPSGGANKNIIIGDVSDSTDTQYTVIDGLIITDLEQYGDIGIAPYATNTTIKNTIFSDLQNSFGGITITEGNVTVNIENCLFEGSSRIGVFLFPATGEAQNINLNISNSTFIMEPHASTSTAIMMNASNDNDWTGSNIKIQNTIIYDSDSNTINEGAWSVAPTYTGSSNVFTSDDRAQTVLGLDNTNSTINIAITDIAAVPGSYDGNNYVVFQETAGGSENYHLADHRFNFAMGAGADLTATIPSDVDGDAITASEHQVGFDFLADTTGPRVQHFYITETDGTTLKPDGAYGNAETMSFIIEFSQVIDVTGTPQITHTASGTAVDCTLHPGIWNALKCDYTVGASDSAAVLTAGMTGLALNGGTITDKAGNAATLTLPANGSGYAPSDNQNIMISAGGVNLFVYVRPTPASCAASVNPDLCYTTLKSAFDNVIADTALTSKNLVSQNVNLNFYIQEDWSTAPGGVDPDTVYISGWTTDATHHITIETQGVARHNGSASCTTCYRMDPSVAGSALDFTASYTEIDGIIITGLEGSGSGLQMNGDNSTVRNIIVYDLHPSLITNGIYKSNSTASSTIENALIYGDIRRGIGWNMGSGTPTINFYIDNVLVDVDSIPLWIRSGGSSDVSGSNVRIRNSAFFADGGPANIYEENLSVSPNYAGTSNIVTGDGSAQTVLGLTNSNSAINVQITDSAAGPSSYDGNDYIIVTETLAGSEDYHLVDNAFNLALGAGTDLTGSIATDYEGDTISAAQYQIGPDYLADTTGPVVQEVYITETDGTTTKPDGAYGNAATMSFIVEFSQVINVTGTPQITHNASATPVDCTIHPSIWNALECEYTVGATDSSADLDFANTTALALNGGTITDVAGNAATLTLPTPGATYSASDDQNVAITAGGITLDIYVRETTCAASPNPPLCYTTLDGAISNLVTDSFLADGDLVTQNANVVIHIQEDWDAADTTQVDVTGFTTGASNFITIIAEGTSRHDGDLSCVGANGCYRMTTAGNSIRIREAYTVVDGIAIVDNSSGAGVFTDADEITLRNMVFKDIDAGNGNSAAIRDFQDNNITTNLENVAILGNTQYGIWVYGGSGAWNHSFNISNSLIYLTYAGSSKGINWWHVGSDFTASNVNMKNTAVFANESIGTHAGSTKPTYTGSTNIITGDDHAVTEFGLTGANSVINATISAMAPGSYDGNDYYLVVNLTAGSENIQLQNNAHNIALGAGTDLTATIPNDIDGDAISAAQHQIGPDYLADTTGPVVQEVYITETDGTTIKPDGTYGDTDTMSFIVKFSQVINVTGTPQITHNASATPVDCTIHPSMWNALECEYTVGATDSSADLDFANTTALALNGGTITDVAGNAATLTLPTPGATYSASDNQAIGITDGTLHAYLYDDCGTAPGSDIPCYEDLAAWDSANGGMGSKDLVTTLDVSHVLHIKGTWSNVDTTKIDLSGWTTDATHTLTITAEGAARHAGVVAAGNYISQGVQASSTGVIIAGSDYTTIDGFIMDGTSATALSAEGIRVTGNEVTIQNMIFRNFNNQQQNDGIHIPANDGITVNVYNSIFYNINRSAVLVQGVVTNSNFNFYNLTAYNVVIDSPDADRYVAIGFDSSNIYDYTGSVMDIRNCYAQATQATVEAFQLGNNPNDNGSWHPSTGNNISDDASAPGSNSIINVTPTATAPSSYDGNRKIVFTSLTGGSEDFHLIDNAYNLALGAGTDLTGTITNDIDDETITGSQHQVGADFIADTTAPVVTEVYLTETDGTTTKPDGSYIKDDTMSFIVEFSQAIAVTGTPQLTHNASATPVDCALDTNRPNALKCDYTVGFSDASADLDFASTAALALNGGTISDIAGNAAVLTLPTPNALYSASDDQAVVISAGSLALDIYVREDCTGAPGQCYTSLANVDGNIVADTSLTSKDLVTQNTSVVIHIDQAWTGPDVNPVSFDNTWTTDASNFITIQTEGAARHDGTANCASCYVLDPNVGGAHLYIEPFYTVMDGLILTGSESSGAQAVFLRGDKIKVRNFIVHNLHPAATSNTVFYVGNDNRETWIENTLMYGGDRSMITICENGLNNVDFHVYNTLFYTTHASAEVVDLQNCGGTSDYAASDFDFRNVAMFAPNGTTYANIGANAPDWTGSTNVITSDNRAQTIIGLDDSNSIINAVITDTIPGVPPTNPSFIVNDLTGGSEDFHIIDNTFNIAFSGFDNLSNVDYTGDIDGDTIITWNHVGADWIADTEGPTITNITSSKADGIYGNTEVVDIEVEFAEPVYSVLSSLSLDSGGTASYISGSGTRILTYRYTVGATDASGDLTVTTFTVADAADATGNSANSLLPIGLNLNDNKDIGIAADVMTLDVYVRETTCASSPAPSRCYTTLADVDGNIVGDSVLTNKNLVGQNTEIVVHIQDDWDNPDANLVSFAGWTADETRHITIQTEGLARHNGDVSCIGVNGCYHIDPTVAGDALKIGTEYTTTDTAYTIIDGLIVTGTESDGSDGIEFHGPGSRVKNSIVFGLNTGSSTSAINTQSITGSYWVENCLIYGGFHGVQLHSNATSTLDYHVHNTLITNVSRGVATVDTYDYSGANIEVINSALFASSVSFGYSGTPTADPTYTGSTNVITGDDDAVTELGLNESNSIINAVLSDTPPGSYDGNVYYLVTNDGAGTEDFHLVDNAFNMALGMGVDNIANLPEDFDNPADTIVATRNQIGPDYLVTSTSAPVVNQVYITEPDGLTIKPDATYNAGDSMSFVVEFSKAINVTGTPQLTIDNSVNTALACSAHPSKIAALKCDYTVGGGQTAADLDYLNTSALALNGGSINDKYGNAAILTLPSPNALYSASDDQAIAIAFSSVTVTITSAPPINASNASSYPISGTCSVDGVGNVDLDVGGITTSTDCTGGTFSTTMNLSALSDSIISCPTDYVQVERNTKYTTEKFCVARYEMKDVGGVATSQPALLPWRSITRNNAISECQALGGTYDLISNSQWQTMAIEMELNPANWYGGVVGVNGMAAGHIDNSPSNLLAVSDVLDPYDGTGNNSGQAFTSGWEQRRTHQLQNGQEIWDVGGNLLEWQKDDLSVAITPDAYMVDITDGTHAFSFNLSSGFADVNDTKILREQFAPSGSYSGLSGLGGYVGRLFTDNNSGTNAIIRGGLFFYAQNGIFTAGTDHNGTTSNENYIGFRCISQISGGHLAQADHSTAPTDSVTVSKDTGAPSAPTIATPSAAGTLTTFDHTFTGSCTAGNIITISGDVIGSPITRECIGGSYSIDVSFTAGDSVKDINIHEADLAGNISSTVNENYDVFASAPSIAITSAPAINIANAASYTVSGTCSPDNTGAIFLDVGGETTSGDCSSGNFNITFDVSSVGDNSSVSVVADYGVVPSATDSTTVLKDTVRPTTLTVPSGATVTKRVQNLTGNCELGSTVSVTGDVETDLGPFTTTCDGGGNYDLDIALSKGSGVKNINVVETDVAGNSTNPPATIAYTYNRLTSNQGNLAIGTFSSCFLSSMDEILCSGRNDFGSRGDGTAVSPTISDTPVKINMSTHAESNDFKGIYGNRYTHCGIHTTNDKAFCWGENSFDEIGNGTGVDTSVPSEIDMSAHAEGNTWKMISISTTDNFTCGVHLSGKVFCWGRNTAGGLGNGDATRADQATPVEIDMSAHTETNNFVHISVGDGNACAVHAEGKLFCWGEAANGRLGTGNVSDTVAPVEVDMSANGLYDNDFVKTSGGDDHMCGLHSSGKIFCWGSDEGATQLLGNGTAGDKLVPTEIDMSAHTEENEFIDVHSYDLEACAIHSNGKLFCWGDNTNGQLATGNNTAYTTPVEVKVSHLGKANNFVEVQTSNNQICALHNDGTFYCSGNGAYGGLADGVGTTTNEFVPVDTTNF